MTARNATQHDGAQLAFAVTREMFDFVEGMWEAPDAVELTAMNGVEVAA